MRRVTIPAGSTPGEKEKGEWVKLSLSELELLDEWYQAALDVGPPTHGEVRLWLKLGEIRERWLV